MKVCVDCGREFKRSPADSTVRCPDCRRAKRPASPFTPAYMAMVDAQRRGREYRREHGGKDDPAIVAEFQHWNGVVQAERAREAR